MSTPNYLPPTKLPPHWWTYILVLTPALVLALLLAWVSGIFTPERPTPTQFVNQMESNGGIHFGYRRNHAKGMCVIGYFEASGLASKLAQTDILEKSTRSNVIGRVSLPGGNPQASDSKAPLLSIALQVTSPSGQEWRTAMLSAPVFLVSTPDAFLEQLRAAAPDPVTGKPNPENMNAFFAAHPETANFRQWASHATPPTSFASTRYNSLNTFRVHNSQGEQNFVRWSLINTLTLAPPTPDLTENPDYLFNDLQTRVGREPITWQLQFQLANSGDPINDATQPWPQDRPTTSAGKLVITNVQLESVGACRDINYNPLILPNGFSPSSDPLLSARAAVYSNASRRRWSEQSGQPELIHSSTLLPSTQETKEN